ncbi:MAG: PD40 domain-containing protein [Phycisphaerae bacterium]|nr:PD40 domain-containing protein [Gemmatimonadaceae bacterium]
MRFQFLLTSLAVLTAIQSTAAQVRYANPRWSPDGRQLMFGANLDHAKRMDVFSIGVDGTNVRKVREDARDASWSPDGKRVVFAVMTAGNLDVYIMNADGTNVQQRTRSTDLEYQPQWSPDGKKIAFLSIQPGAGQRHDIHLMNADGTNRVALTATPAAEESGLTWSPDGKHVAFATNRDTNWEVYSANIVDKSFRRLTNHEGTDNSPAYTPDGRAVVFTSSRGGSRQFWRVSAEGGEATVHAASVATPVAWSPDGRLQAYVGQADGFSGIFVAGISANSTPRRVTPLPVVANKLAQLRWLTGCWERRTPLQVTLEMWMHPEGELMLGASRTVVGGVTTEFEQLRLEARGDTLVYTALPSGQKEAAFRSLQMSDTGFVVENPEHDFPQRIIYRKRGADSVIARVEGPGQSGTRGIDFPMRRAGCGP